MARIRPVSGSDTTTDPFNGPSDSTAALRTSMSSPSTLSPTVESAYVGSSQRPRAAFLLRRAIDLTGPDGATVPTKCLLVDCATILPFIGLPAFGAGFATRAAAGLAAGFFFFFFF